MLELELHINILHNKDNRAEGSNNLVKIMKGSKLKLQIYYTNKDYLVEDFSNLFKMIIGSKYKIYKKKYDIQISFCGLSDFFARTNHDNSGL